MIEDWSTVVAPKYMSLKGWFWQLPFSSPSHEFMAFYVSQGIIDLPDAQDLLDTAW